jgi:hypothetical protein
MTNAVVKVKGIAIELDGTMRIVPPLSLGALEQLRDGLKSFSGDVNDPAQIALIVNVAHAALKRNYPDLTREEVAEMIGLENMMEVFEAVMDVSGMKRRAQEAAAEPGEATPAS